MKYSGLRCYATAQLATATTSRHELRAFPA